MPLHCCQTGHCRSAGGRPKICRRAGGRDRHQCVSALPGIAPLGQPRSVCGTGTATVWAHAAGGTPASGCAELISRFMRLCTGAEWYNRAWAHLLYSVETNEPAFDHACGLSLFEYMEQHPEAATDFNRSMTALSRFEAAGVCAAYDFSGCNTVRGRGRRAWPLAFGCTRCPIQG